MNASSPLGSRRPSHMPDQALEQMLEITLSGFPHEVGGILFPEPVDGLWVFGMVNHADNTLNSISFEPDEIEMVGNLWVTRDEDWHELTLWHSHPSGNIGPSRMDMRNRVPQLGNLVVALTPEGTLIPTWF